ncbi:hypothetical protein BDW74DRAFT_136595 [Aspergillus multicolor]|uniref:uncharacterized protein n=1 Tax=Aspergillus multicolor TaxID=41759 RepID=UPI003CCE237B
MTISASSTKAPSLERRTSTFKGEIANIWAQVQARVVQLAGGDPSKIQADLSIDDVLSCLEKAQDASSKKDSSIRSAFERTLQFIDTVGGVVAGGTGEAFPPSELCFNAVSMVIHTWQDYQGVFESLATLLEKCSQYFSRLEYHIQGRMDAKLAKVAVQHLQLFVEICDRTIKLRRSKRRKLSVFTKLLFLNDNDIADLLEKMKSLVDEEGRLVAAQTFSFAAQAVVSTRENLAISRAVNSKIDMLIASRSDSLKESDKRRRRERILDTLAFDENKLDQEKREPDPYWQRIYYNYRKCVVPGTGQWVFDENEFKAWERGSRDSPSILAIEGTEGSGKSYLSSTIIRRLRNRSSAATAAATDSDSDARTLLAFYFVEGDSKEELKRTNHIDVITKSIIWQFVQADMSYMKSVAGICERNRDIDPHEIATKLLFENPDIGQTIDANFFIVIDGLNDVVGDTLVPFLGNAVSSARSHHKIRILLTGRPRAFEQISAADKGITFRTIHISECNRPDIDMYIESRMDKVEALRNKERFGVKDLRKKIRVALCDKTSGDYFRVNTILKRISHLDYVNDIDQVLENAGRERSQQIQAEIESLNNVRNAKEIAEINEIILWILYGREWFRPRQMAAVLYVQSGELSLLTLEAKLQLKYTLFEVDSDGDVDFRSYEIVELIPEGDQGQALTDQATKRILPEEVDILRHFLRTVCPPALYGKFDFETVFDQKLHHASGTIHRDDKDTAEAKLAVTCLRVLTEKRDARREIIRPYAVNYFHQHLAAVDLSLVDRKWKRVAGPLLTKLFLDEASTDALIWTNDTETTRDLAWMAREAWLDGDGAAREIVRWLKESVAMSDIPDERDRAWVRGLTGSSEPEKELLLRLAKRMVVHWLREETRQLLAVYAFSFILGALKKINRSDKPEKPTANINANGDTTDETPTLEDITELESWSHTLLDCKKDTLWEVQVAVILRNYNFLHQAEAKCRHALTLDPSNWRASYYLAHVVSSNSEAIEILNNIISKLGKDEQWMAEHNHVWAYSEMLFDRGQRYWNAEQFDQAIASFTESVKVNYAGFKRILTIIEQYYDRRLWTDILELLKTIQAGADATSSSNSNTSTSKNKSHLSRMLVDLASEETFHNIVLQTAVETGQFAFIENVYEDAIKLSTQMEAFTSLYYIRYHYANEIFQQDSPDAEERAIALWETALKEDLPRSFLDIDFVLPFLTVKLAPIYLSRASAAEPDSETAHDYLNRIASITPDEGSVSSASTSQSNVILPAKLYLARYYVLTGDKKRAKQIVRSAVKIALEMLSDDDADNDYLAYWRLLLVFLPLDDNNNALAAVAMAAAASRIAFANFNAGPVCGPGMPLIDEPKRNPSPGQSNGNVKDHNSPRGKKERKEQSPRGRPAPSITTNSISLQMHPGAGPGTPDTRRPSTPNSLPRTPELKPVALADLHLHSHSEPASAPASVRGDADVDIELEEEDAVVPIFAICDGGCGRYWQDASEMWWCKDCINLTFDRECFEQLRAGTLPLKICGKDHAFLEVPRLAGHSMNGNANANGNGSVAGIDVPRGYVPLNGKAVSLEEWKRGIVRDYIE